MGWLIAGIIVAAVLIFAGGFLTGWSIRDILKTEQAFECGRKFEAERQAREKY